MGLTRRLAVNRLMRLLCALCCLVVVLLLGAVVIYVVSQGFSHLTLDLITQLPDPTAPNGGGLLNAVTGTLVLLAVSCIFGVSVGLMSGVYLAEFGRGRFAGLVRFLTDVLAGLPSIVAGLVAYGLIVVTTGGFSALSGGVALGLLMFPIVTRTTESVIRLVPLDIREAGLALGIAQWRVLLSLVLPMAAGGLATAIILGVARVAGETAPLLFTAFGSPTAPTGLMQPVSALPLAIFVDSQAPDSQSRALAWAGALVLIALVLMLNVVARVLARHLSGLRGASGTS